MTNENIRLDDDAFANKGVAADFAMIPDLGPFLDFYERPYPRLVPDLATVKVNERVDAYVSTEFHIRGNSPELYKRIINRCLLTGLLTAGGNGVTGRRQHRSVLDSLVSAKTPYFSNQA
jgi:hypothetical protein